MAALPVTNTAKDVVALAEVLFAETSAVDVATEAVEAFVPTVAVNVDVAVDAVAAFTTTVEFVVETAVVTEVPTEAVAVDATAALDVSAVVSDVSAVADEFKADKTAIWYV